MEGYLFGDAVEPICIPSSAEMRIPFSLPKSSRHVKSYHRSITMGGYHSH